VSRHQPVGRPYGQYVRAGGLVGRVQPPLYGRRARIRSSSKRTCASRPWTSYTPAWARASKEATVEIDGEIHEIGYLQPLRQDSEVFFIPKLEGG
jgi:hypothetical protein